MNKRSAIAVALGLVAALAIGGFAIATGLTGPDTSQAAPLVATTTRRPPIVKTVTRTVTVHKQAKAGPAPVIRVEDSSFSSSSAPAVAPVVTAPSSPSETSYEHESAQEDSSEPAETGSADD